MTVYSIRDLEKLSGIKAHTIRIWEQRYHLLNPKRTETNIRYYLDDDLKHLLNVALLKKSGLRISKIAAMNSDEIAEKVKKLSEDEFASEAQLDALTLSMIELDEYKFDKIVAMNIHEIGFEKTMLQLILPFLDKLGLLWLTGSINPIQEAFMSYLIRSKLIVAIDDLPNPDLPRAKKFMIYLPEGEMQELSLLFIHYLIKSRGHKALYLGQNILPTDLKMAYDIWHPDYVFTLINEPIKKQSIQSYIENVTEMLPDVHFLFSGYQIVSELLSLPRNAETLTGLNDTLDFITSL